MEEFMNEFHDWYLKAVKKEPHISLQEYWALEGWLARGRLVEKGQSENEQANSADH